MKEKFSVKKPPDHKDTEGLDFKITLEANSEVVNLIFYRFFYLLVLVTTTVIAVT